MKNIDYQLFDNLFDTKPTTRQIVEKLAIFNPCLMDNDRQFCYFFDQIALKSGYKDFELPPYWSIGRAIYNYKKENNIKAGESAPKKSSLVNDIEVNNPLVGVYKFNINRPSIKQIIEKIAEYDDYVLSNDRKLVELFDTIALNNGYSKDSLPKYWNIIRAAFDYKKDNKGG
ncbi:MAG: hypothetical protein ACI37S_05740 [Candidatus Gastranaerophilaceae bacterium]